MKTFKRIVSIAIACMLLSVSAFATLDGDYANGTFTVSGGEGGLQTSLIIVEGAHTTLPVSDSTVTGAIYIDQTEADTTTGEAAFTGVALTDSDVYTAFFSNEAENSSSSAAIVNASILISADTNEITAGQSVIFTVNATDSVTDANIKAYVNDVETALAGTKADGFTFTPAEAGTYNVQFKATVAGEEVVSNTVVIAVEAAAAAFEVNATDVLDKVYNQDDEGNPINGEIVTPVYVNVTLPEGNLVRMKWVLTLPEGDTPSETIQMNNLAVSGDVTFAAVFKNGLYVDGEDTDYVEVSGVGAIFDIDGTNYYTDDAYEDEIAAEGGNN